MATEQELNVETNGKYKNLSPKPNFKKGIKGLEVENYFYFKKGSFAAGKEIPPKTEGWKPTYLVGITYCPPNKPEVENVSFFVNEAEHELFKNAGGVSDKVKCTLKNKSVTNPRNGVESIYKTLVFEKA